MSAAGAKAAPAVASASKSGGGLTGFLAKLVEGIVIAGVFAFAAYAAYNIRLYAIETYGRVIHEFDPWFNFRATQYLADNGLERFFKWFDHASWYPLGRPVGTTIYPGMQIVAVALWRALKFLNAHPLWKQYVGLKVRMSLNDVCVFIPAWFGSVATIVLGLLTREVSGSWRAGAVAAVVMAIVPAHLMRSVGGGYDNESVAMTAMVLTFFLWCRSLRTSWSWWIGLPAGLAYAFMAAAWGGYIFVGNMVGLHALALLVLQHYSWQLHASYSLWFLSGTLVASQVPVVGLAPYKSLEQLLPFATFIGMQLLGLYYYFDVRSTIAGLTKKQAKLLVQAIMAATVGGLAVMAQLGFFGSLSVRVRSLFIKHTKTGNPLVDSVAEHQPGSSEAYAQYLHPSIFYLAPVGLAVLLSTRNSSSEGGKAGFGVQVSKWFVVLYAVVAYYFANRMSRLIILLGPVASALAGIALSTIGGWVAAQLPLIITAPVAFMKKQQQEGEEEASKEATAAPPATPSKKGGKEAAASKGTEGKGSSKKAAKAAEAASEAERMLPAWLAPVEPAARAAKSAYSSPVALFIRIAAALALIMVTSNTAPTFWKYCDNFARQISQPSLMFKARLRDGSEVMVNDYQEAYWWLRDNTPQDARVLSWWDYGYQIAGIGNRTTLADGNTWNLEHIALIGRILTSPEARAHKLAKHLADYVLVWAGNSGDDLAKSPHMARIGSSVFPDICPKDPLCRNFGFYQDRSPTPSMAASLLYKLHSNGIAPGVKVNPKLFQEVYSSKYGLVRIYKVMNIDEESKAWAADPANKECDAPGSWYCPGKYPPKLPLTVPKSHRHLDYDNAEAYVEEAH